MGKTLTHWGRLTHICVSKLIIVGSDNGLSPGRRQTIIWTNAGIVLIGPLGTNFSEIIIEIHAFSFMKMHLNMSFGKRRPFCLGLNVLTTKTPRQCVMVYLSNRLGSAWYCYIRARFNIKTVFPRYGDSHVKDKTVGETVLSITWESLYW